MNFNNDVRKMGAILTEHHMQDFDTHLASMAVADLLDRLEAKEGGNPKLYKALEEWIRQTYPHHINKRSDSKFEDEGHDIESIPGIENQY